MSDQPDWERAQAVVDDSDTYDGTWAFRGEELPLRTEAPSLTDLREMDEQLDAEDADVDLFELFVDEYLVRPEVDASDLEVTKLRALYEGMQSAWGEAVDISEIEDEMPVEGGNG